MTLNTEIIVQAHDAFTLRCAFTSTFHSKRQGQLQIAALRHQLELSTMYQFRRKLKCSSFMLAAILVLTGVTYTSYLAYFSQSTVYIVPTIDHLSDETLYTKPNHGEPTSTPLSTKQTQGGTVDDNGEFWTTNSVTTGQETAQRLTKIAQSVSRTLRNVDKCMTGSNLSSPALLQLARDNAKLFMVQYGRVISPHYLHDYTNYCWNTSYQLSLRWDFAEGHIGRTKFSKLIPRFWFGMGIKSFVNEEYDGHFASSTVCLPNIYLLGFEKSGSTFFWCLLSRMLNQHSEGERIQATKEPYFWTPFTYKAETPNIQKLATNYIPMFLRGADERLSVQRRKELAMIDGCPSTVIEWPRFSESEPELTNYCLLPSALPELFPESKYLVIMRNPVDMLYSAFWWSFHAAPNRNDLLSQAVKWDHTKGPRAFTVRVGKKIVQFLNCINRHPTVKSEKGCTLWGKHGLEYSECIGRHTHLLSECVANITTKRVLMEAVLHRGVYYVHVRKWLLTVPRERIFFTTMEKLSRDTYTVLKEAYKFFKGDKVNLSRDDVENIKLSCRENKNNVNYKSPSLKMLGSTRTMLEKFFEPFNKLLSNLLQDDQFLW